MRFENYTRTYCVLLACGIVALVFSLILGLADSADLNEEKKMLATAGLAIIASALAVNASCGIRHKKMLGRGTYISTYEKSGRWFFIVDVSVNVVVCLIMLCLALQVCTGAIAIFF